MESAEKIPAEVPAAQAAAPHKPLTQSVGGRIIALVRGQAVLFAVMALTVLFFVIVALVLRADLQPTSWDRAITHEIQELPTFGVGQVLIAVSLPGFSPWNWILALGLMSAMLLRRLYVEAAFMTLAALGGLLAEAVKLIIDRPRPTPDLVHVVRELHSYSFPSGHVTGYVCLFGFLFYLVYSLLPHTDRRRLPLLVGLALPVVLIGVSRVYMGQHWASDALAGYALGFAYLLIVIEAYRAWLRRTNAKTLAVPAKDQGPGTRP